MIEGNVHTAILGSRMAEKEELHTLNGRLSTIINASKKQASDQIAKIEVELRLLRNENRYLQNKCKDLEKSLKEQQNL